MADLSAYVDFAVKIDKSGATPVIVITDISSYPTGVASAINGYVAITQPDGITLSPNFSGTADITGTSLSTTKSYRTASDGSIQNGTYSVTYTVKCSGYSDTIKIKTFTLNYSTPKPVITPYIDVFTPQIKVGDGTSFTQANFTLLSQTRSWAVTIYYVGTAQQQITGTSQLLDLAVSGSYYDAKYYALLTENVTYEITTATWMTIVDKASSYLQFDAYTPLTLSQLQTALDTLGAQTNYGNCNNTVLNKRFLQAQALLTQITARGEQGDTVGLDVYEQQLERIFFPYNVKTHTNAAISAYIFNNTVLPSVTLPAGTSSYTMPAGSFLMSVVAQAPTAANIGIGTTALTNDLFDVQYANPITVFDGKKFFQAATTIYFNGVLSNTVIKIYKQ